MNRLALCLLGVTALGGCKDKDPFADGMDVLTPVGTRDGLAYADRGNDEVLFVHPGDERLEVTRQALDDPDDTKVSWIMESRDGEHVMVLTVPESDKVEDVSETLYRFDADGGSNPVTYDVRAPFNACAFSPDHERLVLYFSGDDPGSPLQNANQVAIVDLATSSVRNLTLNGFGGRLTSVHFPGQIEEGVPIPVNIGNFARDIVAFLAAGEIVLVDMDDPNADQVAVRFDAETNFEPVDTLLRPGDDLFEDAILFLRPQNGANVAMLTLVNKPDEVTAVPGFTAQISLLDVGGTPSDFVFYNGESPYLVTLSSGSRMVFSNLGTQDTFEVDLEGSASRLFLRDHESSGGNVITQAVAWAPGATSLHTLDLDGIENSLGRKPKHMNVQTGIDQLVQLDNDRLLIGSGNNLYVVDFPENLVTPLTSQVPYDPGSSALQQNQLLLGTPGQYWVSSVDLQTLNPESMLLDDPINQFHYAADTGKVMITHTDPIGHLTVVDGGDPSRSTSYVEWGFLLEGLLD